MDRQDTKLSQLVTAKTKYIPDALYYEALHETKKDIEAHPIDFGNKSKAEKLQYIADAMAVYVIMERRVRK